MLPRLYAIADGFGVDNDQLINNVAAAIAGGCALIQYRDKTALRRQRLERADRLAQLCTAHNCSLLINDDIDLAKKVAAHGVHLGQEDDPVARAKDILGEQAIIGVTCHNSLSLARQAQLQGASYLAFGRFFTSLTKPQAPQAAVELLSAAKSEMTLPLVAIGGITIDNAPQLISAGADSLAVGHALFSADDIKRQAQRFCRL